MATHSSMLAWKIPWIEDPGRLQSMGSQRVRQDWADFSTTTHLWKAARKKRLTDPLPSWRLAFPGEICKIVAFYFTPSTPPLLCFTLEPDILTSTKCLRLSAVVLLSLNTVSPFAWTARLRGSLDSLTMMKGKSTLLCCCCSVSQWCLTLCDPGDCSTPGLPLLHHITRSLLKLRSAESVMPVITVNCVYGTRRPWTFLPAGKRHWDSDLLSP